MRRSGGPEERPAAAIRGRSVFREVGSISSSVSAHGPAEGLADLGDGPLWRLLPRLGPQSAFEHVRLGGTHRDAVELLLPPHLLTSLYLSGSRRMSTDRSTSSFGQ
jgi:hypothetical protein